MHKYQLQKYSGMHSRYRCPACQNRRKTFTLYIDTETQQPLAAHVGKCERLDKCGYHYTPKMWFGDNEPGAQKPVMVSLSNHRAKAYPPSSDKLRMTATHHSIPQVVFKRSLKHYRRNNLVIFLNTLFGTQITRDLMCKYLIGTAKHWPGATVFWQIDIDGKIRTGKVMLYDAVTGRRVKQPFNHIAWVHKLLSGLSFQLPVNQHGSATDNPQLTSNNIQQCLFGEHLLKNNNLPVAIVESEKTALIASVYLPQYIWLATGGLGNLTAQKCSVLKGRKVFLFPDLNGFDAWAGKAAMLSGIASFKLCDILENSKADERQAALDIADYLVGMAGNS